MNEAPITSKASDAQTQNARQMFPLVRRFILCRWSDARKRIHALPVCGEVLLPKRKRNSITTSITRLQEAYEHTRRYCLETRKNGILVRRSL